MRLTLFNTAAVVIDLIAYATMTLFSSSSFFNPFSPCIICITSDAWLLLIRSLCSCFLGRISVTAYKKQTHYEIPTFSLQLSTFKVNYLSSAAICPVQTFLWLRLNPVNTEEPPTQRAIDRCQLLSSCSKDRFWQILLAERHRHFTIKTHVFIEPVNAVLPNSELPEPKAVHALMHLRPDASFFITNSK